jgi:hypothetical protein
MRSQPVENRVEKLEERVVVLEQLPSRIEKVELQIQQVRGEMRDEFSAVRHEMRDEFAAVRQEMRELGSALREEIRATNRHTIEKLTESIEAARREARVLYEDVIARIATLGEAQNGRKKRRTK